MSASSGTTGSLIRVLKSLADADYSGVPAPHLTVELPSQIDQAAEEFMSKFRWPPKRGRAGDTPNLLTLRKRIPPRGVNEEEANMRFMESFYPSKPEFSHAVVLSPQAEVSAQFFHYLRYALFEYKYSDRATLQGWNERLFGISLHIPGTCLDGTTEFTAPQSQVPMFRGKQTSFLWQAPAPHAVLFTGDKWVELHQMVEQSMKTTRQAGSAPELLRRKEITKSWPAWMEYVLRVCRLRGYWIMYPSPEESKALVTIHTERALPPEEYEAGSSSSGKDGKVELVEGRKDETPLSVMLPGAAGSSLLPFNDMPILSWEGDVVGLDELDDRAREFRKKWRAEVGGCAAGDPETEQKTYSSTRDLFCSFPSATR